MKKSNNKKTFNVIFGEAKPETSELIYSVIIARYQEKWVLCRHKQRSTFEVPGGHIEKNENCDEAAKRELYEETGAEDFTIEKVCIYGVERDGVTRYGALYFAEIKSFGKLPDMEIAEILFFDDLPKDLTYPQIQPLLFAHVKEWLKDTKSRKKYKAVIFDLDGTLFDHFGAVEKSFEKLYNKYSVFHKMAFEEFLKLNKNLLKKYFILYRDKQISWEDHRIYRIKALYSHFGISLSDDEANEKFIEYLKIYESCWQPLDNAPLLLKKLKDVGYKLGIITNGESSQQHKKIHVLGIEEFFDSTVISSDFGFAKPDVSIFKHALQELGVEEQEAIYVGDSISSDICGAANAGIDSIYIIRDHNREAETDCRPDCTIYNLHELFKIIS